MFLLGFVPLLVNSLARPTYILLTIPYIILLFEKKAKPKKIIIKFITLIVLSLPLIFNFIWNKNNLDFLTGDYKLIIDDYLERYTRDSYEFTSMSVDSIFTTWGFIKRILVNIFAYRHITIVEDVPLFFAILFSRISTMFTFIISILFLVIPNKISQLSTIHLDERKLWIVCSLNSIFLYPFPR